jgi:predicted  nucleic acid-binding Zn-ribbon protein
MMQELEDRADAFEVEVTRVRADLREAKQNLRNAIRRNETDAIEISRLGQEVMDLTRRLNAGTAAMSGLDSVRFAALSNRLLNATNNLVAERLSLAPLNVEARRVNPVDVL